VVARVRFGHQDRRVGHPAALSRGRALGLAVALALAPGALAQPPAVAPPVVGADTAERRAIDQALRSGDHETAERLLVAAAERAPQSAELLRLLGGIFFVRNKPLNAAIAFKKAEALEPLDEMSRFTLAMAYVALGQRAWARPELGKLVADQPRSALYVYWLGRLDYDDGRHAEAAAHFLRALEREPGLVKAHDNLGLAYEALGRNDEARASFEEAVRLNRLSADRSPWPPLNLGLLLVRLDDVGPAEALFREAAEADPTFAPARYQLGLRLERAGREAEAVAEIQEAARLDPAYAEAQYALARLYRRRGDVERADRALLEFQRLKKEKGQSAQGPR